MTRSDVEAAMRVWRDGLMNLTSRNRLLKFRETKTGALTIAGPDPELILSGLRGGISWDVVGRVATAEGDQTEAVPVEAYGSKGAVLQTTRLHKELGPLLRTMLRRANAEFLDRGLSVLYLAFGMLHWQDEDGTAMSSPLLLVPVKLQSQGPNAIPQLSMGDDDTVVNPSLVLRLRDFGMELPALDDIPELSMSDLLREIRAAVAARKDWWVDPTVVLSTFTFHKEAMYRDLLENEKAIADHPVVTALSAKDPANQTREFLFEPVAPSDIDHAAPPEDMPLVLDADSSQRAAIAAALGGRSFIMDGPPGTGKSQTISNMIGALLHARKTVLFVSEKAAALEVVRNRLAEAGLEAFLLELHSHKASRKEVAAALAQAVDNIAVPPQGLTHVKRTTLMDRRVQLNNYAAAMNEIRDPLGLSPHDVLGILAQLTDVPSAPVPEIAPKDLSQAQLHQIRDVAMQLKRAWRPARQGETFLWRDVVDDTSLDVRLYQADSCLDQLVGLRGVNRPVVAAFSLHKLSDTAKMAALLELQHDQRPDGVPVSWLLTDDWPSVTTAQSELTNLITEIRSAEDIVLENAGVSWTLLPDASSISHLPSLSADRNPIPLGALSADRCAETAEQFQSFRNSIDRALSSALALAKTLELPAVQTFTDADRLVELVDLAYSRHRPLRDWLEPRTLKHVRSISDELRAASDRVRETEDEAGAVFAPVVLTQPVHEVLERFTTQHRGLRKLLGKYRADKKLIASWLIDGVRIDIGIKHLDSAVRWLDAVQHFTEVSSRAEPVLGRYFDGRATDFAVIDEAVSISVKVQDLMKGAPVPAALTAHLTAERPTDYRAITSDIRDSFTSWTSSLAPAPAVAGRPELAIKPIQESIRWLESNIEPLVTAAARIRAIDDATGSAHSLDDVEVILQLRDAAANAHAQLTDAALRLKGILDTRYQGVDSDLDSLALAINWASHLRAEHGGPLTEQQVQVLDESHPVAELRPSLEKWTGVCDRIVSAFDDCRHAELESELDDADTARELISELRADSVGQEEWFDYVKARHHLEKYGLGAAIDFCIEHRVEAETVPKVIERALLRSWADNIVQHDTRIRPLLARDRDALVAEYRELDKMFVDHAVAEIIAQANNMRPSVTEIGEPGIIRREGMKKSRHWPVRELISRTRNTSMAIKPCFMMSPLAVSQYLPSDMRFDVVIFDEASQVRPGDAINCIYRGKSLILAGDDKQLPPTSFFERLEGEVDVEEDDTDVAEFQSVLELAKGSGAFINLRLNWHYRSRHEDLIAYSNYKFYDGSLITYPSACAKGDDVGVEFIDAGGTYRRGGGADNPLEAAVVADRVLHHFTSRPNLTLGVVTFSVAQADAIHAALAKAREERRDLDRFFDESDRLSAFFVKSLESVQGDERDVIIFSIGYGPDEAGKVTTSFGVLNKPKGWRRLNVAVTRARHRIEVVSSLRAAQIPPSQNENVEYLRSYLDYAERGPTTLALNTGTTGLEPESPFEESVLKALQDWGYECEPQVGSAGYRIDIGVRHPDRPGVFAIGIECDGYQYHSAPAARDRDRLRDAVLTGLGWRLHRIWGTAWYRNRSEEEARLREAVERAIKSQASHISAQNDQRVRPRITTELVDVGQIPGWVSEYKISDVPDLPRWVDPSGSNAARQMLTAIALVARVEGPVHIDVVHQRLREGWRLGRISPRVRENIERAIRQTPGVVRNGDFLDVEGRAVDRVRGGGENPRKAEHVHLAELQLAITMLLRDSGITAESDITTGVKRIFGWTRAGAEISRRVSFAIDELAAEGTVLHEGGQLRLA